MYEFFRLVGNNNTMIGDFCYIIANDLLVFLE